MTSTCYFVMIAKLFLVYLTFSWRKYSYNLSNFIFFHYSFTNHPFMKHDFQKFETMQYCTKLSLHHCIIVIFFFFNWESNHGLTHLFSYKHGNDPSITYFQNHVCSIKIIYFCRCSFSYIWSSFDAIIIQNNKQLINKFPCGINIGFQNVLLDITLKINVKSKFSFLNNHFDAFWI